MTSTSHDRRTVFQPSDLESMTDLSAFLTGMTEPAALLGPDGQTVPLPIEAFEILKEVAEAMRSGKAVTVAPLDQVLTTQEAATFLGVSRPTLVRALESGALPFSTTPSGRHRRVRLDDLMAFRAEQDDQRRAALAKMTKDAAAAGLYGDAADDYREALSQARGKAAGKAG